MTRAKGCKRAPRNAPPIKYGFDSVLDSEFDSYWRPPVTLCTDQTDAPPRIGESWRASFEGVES